MATTTSEEMNRWAVQGIRKALNDLDAEKDRLLQALSVLENKPELAPHPGNKMSDEGRKRISDAQKARWAKKKQTLEPPPLHAPFKRKPGRPKGNGSVK